MEITLKNLKAGYFINKKEYSLVIENLTVSFEKGKIHFLAGVSGSGKSTLLETICLLIKKISGEILFDNKSMDDKKNLDIFRKYSGIILQYTEKQFFNNTVEDEIIFNLKRNKIDIEQIKIKLHEICEKLNIDRKLLHASPFEISGGEKRIVALASVLISSPKILFLDEPTVGLDFESKKIFMSSLKSFNKHSKLTIIQSSHILEDVIEYGDTVLILNKNKEFINGNPRDLLFSKEILNNYGLSEPEIYKYKQYFKNLGAKDIDNVRTNDELINKLFYNN